MSLNEKLDLVRDPYRVFKFFDHRHLLDWMPDKAYLKLAFRMEMGYPLDLKDPKTFNQKLQWLKLYDRDPLYTTLVDKYAVRRWVADKVGEEYLIPLVGGPWERAEDIDLDALPDQFVLKCNHDSGGVIVCRDKSSFDLEGAVRDLNHRLSCNYYHAGREWPYKNVVPCIFAEALLLPDQGTNEVLDYKFFCFNGKPKVMYVASDGSQDPRTDLFDMDFKHLDLHMRDPSFDSLPERPKQFEEMKRIAETLSQAAAHMRVDMYISDGRICIGEMTLFHCSGFVKMDPPQWDYRFGSWLELPEKKKGIGRETSRQGRRL